MRSKNIDYEEIDVTNNAARRAEMEMKSARKTVPQIFIDGIPIGGFDEARQLDATGELERLLRRSSEGG